MSDTSRVCDRCIRFVTSDLQRPCCSRCLEGNHSCTYSTRKRKPGPPRGSRPRLRNISAENQRVGNPSNQQVNDDGLMPITYLQPRAQLENPVIGDNVSMQFASCLHRAGPSFLPHASMTLPALALPYFPGYYLDRSQEKDMLLRFFDDVHPAIPLFQKSRFLKSYDEGAAFYDLVVIINAITAKLIGPVGFWPPEDVDLCLNSLLEATACESDSLSSRVSLDHLRQECLLAYYNFHRFPEPPAGMRISRLTRKAYTLGLNQIENPDLCSAFDQELVTEDEIEDWRYVWWCVYRLDSYSNIAFGTPFIVDGESINSALIRRSLYDEIVPSSPKLFLTDDIDQLWRTLQDVVSNYCGRELNIHILTTAMLRHAGNVLTLKATRKCVDSKTVILGDAVTSVLLALPSGYLNPKRNVLAAESDIHHCIRVTNILHLHFTRLIACSPSNLYTDEAQWFDCWQQSLEICRDIVSVIDEWTDQFWTRVDPALCLIVFKALWVTNLHRRSATNGEPALISALAFAESTLVLFLEKFSKIWTLPKTLLQLFRNSTSNDLLTYDDINRFINRFKMPLHPKTHVRSYPIR
ncbi:uncharacterized protein F4812DRAFT_449369 [Daldinia caldariorum]|uniref:uncharacterized protein n=1 Tax=Daldinia caldariorum TaxID=326644 RepID=UPI00200794E6|nr:uncharacterized protein F4812DRAFT_449369 [Daldinia caldariorum]KAI1471118.1 hypothetical protein F4812DRAFT_449369 [Daldinia caldariorum]